MAMEPGIGIRPTVRLNDVSINATNATAPTHMAMNAPKSASTASAAQ